MSTTVKTAVPASPTIAESAIAGYERGRHPPAPAAAPAAGAPGIPDTAAAAATGGADAITGAANTVTKKVKGFWDDLSENGGIGKILGGLIGLLGAWFLGGFFGDGIMSTILMVALAVPLMMIGSDKVGGMINGWMGNKQGPALQTVQAPAVGKEQPREAAPVGKPLAISTLTAAQLDTLVADARAAGKQADTVILVKDGDEVSVKSGVTPENLAKPNERVTVQQLHDIIAGNQAKGGAAAIGFATYSNTDRVTLTFVPKAALENSQSRS